MNNIKLENFKYMVVRAELCHAPELSESSIVNSIEAIFRYDDEAIEYVNNSNNACASNTILYFWMKL